MTLSEGRESREPMWAIRPSWGSPYFMLFTLQVVAGISIVTREHIAVVTDDSTYDTFIGIIRDVVSVGLASAIITFTITEILEGVMFTGMWIRQKFLEPLKESQRAEGRAEGRFEGLAEGRAEGRSEGLAEGRAAMIAEMMEWDRRRQDAEARGEPFHETPPYLRS